MSSPASDNSPSTAARGYGVHTELLLTLIAMLIVQSLLSPESVFQRIVFHVLFLGLVISAIRTFSSSRRRLMAATMFGVIGFTVSWFTDSSLAVWPVVVVDCSYIAIFGLLLVALRESVFSDDKVDANRIVGAVSIYLVLGLLWTFTYSLLEAVQPGSFTNLSAGARHEGMTGQFLYFSNVTLTTLGYGDIAPVTNLARMLATLESIVGQLYLTIVVAFLVGVHIKQKG